MVLEKNKKNKAKCILCVRKNLTVIASDQKLQLEPTLSETYGIASYGSGWRKDVIN